MKKILTIFATLIGSLGLVAQNSVYDFTVKDANDKEVSLSRYRGKVILVVNTATECGFTPQYKELQTIYEKYASKGLVILDFPCNQFGGQAPGTMQEINAFCTGKYHTTFDRMMKVDVNGEAAAPLWKYLYGERPFEGFGKGMTASFLDKMLKEKDADYASNPDIKWNFTKFLIDREGKVIARFEPTTDKKLWEKAIKEAL